MDINLFLHFLYLCNEQKFPLPSPRLHKLNKRITRQITAIIAVCLENKNIR